jgi:6-pyruvoyltetrahydropterin/6-carboxytetrahydropterin synthase
MERWSIEVEKEYFKFSAAHFLIFPDGRAERLHGHNYRVFVAVEGKLSRYGLVIDFTLIKPIVRELLDSLDERFLLPEHHPEVKIQFREESDEIEVSYRERRYVVPREDVRLLPINNTSSENLAAWIGREFRALLLERFSEVDVRSLRVAVEETSGQRGVYTFVEEK